MRRLRVRFTVRGMIAATAAMSLAIAAWGWVAEAYEARRFRRAWDSRGAEGTVLRVSSRCDSVALSLGADDGLIPGQEFYLVRPEPRPRYLGRVRIVSAGPDEALGRVTGVACGAWLREGDMVVSTVPPPRWKRGPYAALECGYAEMARAKQVRDP